MKKDIKLTCSLCEDDTVGIFSVTQIHDREVEIVFVCNGCGGTKVSKNYLYKIKENIKG